MTRMHALATVTVLLILAVSVEPLFAGDVLSLTVAPAQEEYELYDTVHVSGSLMWVPHNIPVKDGIVAVEISDPSGHALLIRTRPTGPTLPQDWVVNFTQFYPCDSNAVPKYSFEKGESIWIYAEWKNFDKGLSRNVLVFVAVYDANSVPVRTQYSSGILVPGGVGVLFFQLTTSSALAGTVTLYANLFSDYPRKGGYPYCPEKAATFTVATSGTGLRQQTAQSELTELSDGAFDMSFKLASESLRYGIYVIYVGTYYYQTIITGNDRFKLRGFDGDVNGDQSVDIYDAILLSNAYGSTPASPNWNPRTDINMDDVVDIYDAIKLSNDFGKRY